MSILFGKVIYRWFASKPLWYAYPRFLLGQPSLAVYIVQRLRPTLQFHTSQIHGHGSL